MSPRLRIAVLSRRFDPAGGGAERYAIALVQQLASRHEIHVFAQEFLIEIPGVVNHRVPRILTRPRWLNLGWFSAWTHWQTRRGFDIVHSHEAVSHGDVQTIHVRPIRATRFSGIHGWQRFARWLGVLTSPRLAFYFWIEAARLKPGRRLIAVSEALRDDVIAAYPALAGKIDIVPPGVTPAQAGSDRETTRAHHGIPSEAPLLLFIAGDYDKKGLPALQEALVSHPDAHLLVVGNANYIPPARRLAEELGIAERVHFAGVLADPSLAYRAADLLAHPTLEDTFGMVVVEAMAYGLPVIVSAAPWCGISATLADGEDALMLPDPRDSEHLAQQIGRLLNDAALRDRLARAGLAVAARFDWPRIACLQETLYLRTIATETQPE
ncbi:glycosyltransferase family 4 protein [Niveibacterium terrae]|uniref:glycosyltransferase family 4 protein n=1 Tax=Niveibacterium terrae TaxID=3373598 RepID=UPI003A8F2062